MPYRVDDVKFRIEPVRLTLVELDSGPWPCGLGLRKSALGLVLATSAGVGGPDDSVDAGATSNARRGRGRRIRGCSAIVYGRLVLVSFGDHENSSFWRLGVGAMRRANKSLLRSPFKYSVKMDQVGEFHRAEWKSGRYDASDERIVSVRISRRAPGAETRNERNVLPDLQSE